MFNDFEIKLNKDDPWKLRYLHVYHGIFIAESENEYKKGKKIELPKDVGFSIDKDKTPEGEEFFKLTMSAKGFLVFVRAQQKIALEYIIYNSQQKNEKDMGRPMTFVPHLINIDSPLYYTRRENLHFQGLINLIVVLLVVSHIRLMYDNIMKTGIIFTKERIAALMTSSGFTYIMYIMGFIVFSILNTFFIEKIAYKIQNEFIVGSLNFVNFCIILSAPFVLNNMGFYEPITAMFGLFILVIVWLKLYSYAHFWMDVRKFIAKKKKVEESHKNDVNITGKRSSINDLKETNYASESSKEESRLVQKGDKLKSSMYEEIENIISKYPENVCFKSLFVFLFMPVLCFQFKFPRTNKIRFGYLIEYGTKIIVCSFLQR